MVSSVRSHFSSLLDCSFHNIGSFYGYESEIKGEKWNVFFYGNKIITQFDESFIQRDFSSSDAR